MNTECNHEWSYIFLLDSFPKKFLDGPFRKHRENVFYDLEKGLLPETQNDVELILRFQHLIETIDVKLDVVESYAKICVDTFDKHLRMDSIVFRTVFPTYTPLAKSRVLTYNYRMLERGHAAFLGYPQIPQTAKDILTTNLKLLEKWFNSLEPVAYYRKSIKDIMENVRTNRNTMPVQEKRKFIKHCPSNDCRGFLSTQWNCGLCHIKVCSVCHVSKIEGEEHVCKKDDIETAAFLMKDTRPCTSCGTAIHKIDGCDQMWCVLCHTAFSWTTGEISLGLIHNPHYFQHMRANRREERNPMDVICGRDLNHNFIAWLMRKIDRVVMTPEFKPKIEEVIRQIIFLKSYAEAFVPYNATDNRKIRIAYLMNEFDEDSFKRKIFIKQRHNEFNREFRNWLLLFRDVSTDLMYNMDDKLNVRETQTQATLENFMVEIESIQELVNKNIIRLSQLFKIKDRFFDVKISSLEWNVDPCR
jgi:hypothetical protein